jgi:putative ABC transport system permease protein
MTLTEEVQAAVWTVDDQQPVTSLGTYEDLVARSMSQPFFQMLLLGFFALVALVLAALGIYGVIGYYVAQRVREVGIRMALGADRRDVYRLVVGRGAMLAGAGLVVGLVSAFGVTRFMASLLFGVGATDVATFTVVPAVLGIVALLASYLPARRAAGLDPMTALRSEQ